MPTHLYCLLAAASDSAPPSDAGEVRALVVGEIVAWVATVASATLSREGRRAAQRVVEHDRVIAQALARGVTPVPASLADPYPDDDAATRDISSRSREIVDALSRVAGVVEMAVILAGQPEAPSLEAPTDLSPGHAYLQRLRDLPQLLESAADEIDRRLAPLTLSTARRVDRGRVGLSHLVRWADLDAYRSRALQCASDRYRMVVDGPRAPYSFAAFSPASGPFKDPSAA